MIDAAQFPGCNENKRVVLLGNVVNGEVFFSQRNHETAGSFHQYDVVTAGKFLCGMLYLQKSIGRLSMRAARWGEQG